MKFRTNTTLIFDIDGVIRDVSSSYHRALADTVEHFTDQSYRPTALDIVKLKSEGIWNNDWEASFELIRRFMVERSLPCAVNFEQVVDYFQRCYRGDDWNGYIQNEPLLVNQSYFNHLTEAGISWGFFSGASRASATFVLDRLNIVNPVLVAMEDAPGKPDPTGLFLAIEKLRSVSDRVIYVGDTVADMLTINRAREVDPGLRFWAIGVIPPHVEDTSAYGRMLQQKGADLVLESTLLLTPEVIADLLG
jgi:HAD superfamily phosphatase